MFPYLAAPNSIVTIGIAGVDIADDVHPGQWNRSIGYQNTGSCYSSHFRDANTEGQKYVTGNE